MLIKYSVKDKLKKYFGTIVSLALIIAVMCMCAFYPERENGEAIERRVVRIWNVDTFEGGKGSRTNFLKSAARRVEKNRSGVFYLVSSYTPEGAEAAFREGNAPDAISFGVGLSVYAEQSLSLPYSFSGGVLGKDALAYPWCKGGYALFSLTDNFEEAGNTVISCGGSNLPQVSAALSGITGEELPALTAYTKFLGGEYRYLLGTQRDLCRFQSRNVAVYYKPLSEYCDLYQYYSVLSSEKKDDCLALLDELLSAPEKLSDIGMFPLEGDLFAPNPKSTLGVFTSSEALKEILETARGSDGKKLGKFLKTIEL